MIYDMKIRSVPFSLIRQRKKTIELRLFDSKRRRLDIGDYLIFTNIEDETEKVAAQIKGLFRAGTFEELFDDLSLEECGFEQNMTKEEAVNSMRQYYSEKREQEYGVLGIKMELADLERVLSLRERSYEDYLDRLFPDGMK